MRINDNGLGASFDKPSSFSALHSHAVALHKQGDIVGAVQAYTTALSTLDRAHKTHPTAYTTLTNRARAWVSLGTGDKALADARKARSMTTVALQRCACCTHLHTRHANNTSCTGLHDTLHAHLRTFVVEAQALLLLDNPHDALSVCEDGLLLQPSHPQLRATLQDIMLRAPRTHVRHEDMELPTPMRLHHVLLDPALKDAYTYLGIKCDLQVPVIRMQQLANGWSAAFADAAVHAVRSRGQGARVLLLGAGAGTQETQIPHADKHVLRLQCVTKQGRRPWLQRVPAQHTSRPWSRVCTSPLPAGRWRLATVSGAIG